MKKTMQEVFAEIYAENKWGNGSGPGSKPEGCMPYLNFLRLYYKDKNALEIGCGDMQLYAATGIPFRKYCGYDVVSFPSWKSIASDAISISCGTYDGHPGSGHFNLSQLKPYDVILIKDVLNHLPNHHTEILVKNRLLKHKPNYCHLVLTHDYNPELETSNKDIEVGGHRPLALEEEPFNLVPTFKFIWHCSSDDRYKQTLVII